MHTHPHYLHQEFLPILPLPNIPEVLDTAVSQVLPATAINPQLTAQHYLQNTDLQILPILHLVHMDHLL